MGFTPTHTSAQIYRDYTTDGVPASGLWLPPRLQVRTWGTEVEAALTGLLDNPPERVKLSSATTFYVSPDTGSDSNNGTTPSTPWATLQHAANYIKQFVDIAGQSLNVACANSANYQPFSVTGHPVGGHVWSITGNVSDPSLCTMTIPLNDIGIYVKDYGCIQIAGFRFRSPSGCNAGVWADQLAIADVANCIFDTFNYGSHLLSTGNASLGLTGANLIDGGASRHLVAQRGAQILMNHYFHTIRNSCTFSLEFAAAHTGGHIFADAGAGFNPLTGVTVTCKRYDVVPPGQIETFTGNINLFPGSVAGTVQTPVWYD